MSKIPILTHEEADNRIYAALYHPVQQIDKAGIREMAMSMDNRQPPELKMNPADSKANTKPLNNQVKDADKNQTKNS